MMMQHDKTPMDGRMTEKTAQTTIAAATPVVGTPVLATPVTDQHGVVVGQPVGGADNARVGGGPGAESDSRGAVAGELHLVWNDKKNFPEYFATRDHVPLMLPGSLVARPPVRSTKFGMTRPRNDPPLVLGPGKVLTAGQGAVCAGPQKAPHGKKGAAVGCVFSLGLGDPLLVAGPILGYFACKKLDRAQNSVGLHDQEGKVVNVKLWKAGKHAPLTEAGYWLVASDPRDSEMELFATRIADALGLPHVFRDDAAALTALARRHSGSEGIASLAQLRADLVQLSSRVAAATGTATGVPTPGAANAAAPAGDVAGGLYLGPRATADP